MDLARLWACDLRLDRDRAAALVAAAFPELRPTRAAPLAEGWDCQVFVVNDLHAFRFPKRAEVGPRLVAEQALTRGIARDLPLPVPDARWLGAPGPDFPWPWLGHPLIRGVPATSVSLGRAARRRIGAVVGGFIAALHALRPAPLGVAARPALAEDLPAFREVARQLSAALAPAFTPARAAGVAAFLAGAPPAAPAGSRPPVLLHGELTASNLILDLDTREVAGVIDWTDARVGDPAADFAGLFQHGGEELLEAALAAYPAADDALAARARFIGRCGALLRLAHALDAGQADRAAGAWGVVDQLFATPRAFG